MNVMFKKISDGVTKRIEGVVSRSQNIRGYLTRVVYDQYLLAQIDRWKTYGASQEKSWPALTTRYREYKLKRYSGYPYSGTRTGIATGTLFKATAEKGSRFHRRIVWERGIQIMVDLDYAQYFDMHRSISEWSPKFIAEVAAGVRDYIMYGKQ